MLLPLRYSLDQLSRLGPDARVADPGYNDREVSTKLMTLGKHRHTDPPIRFLNPPQNTGYFRHSTPAP